MQHKQLKEMNYETKPFTLYFQEGILRVEIEPCDDLGPDYTFRLYVLQRVGEETRILHKQLLPSILIETIQYVADANSLVYLESSQRIAILNLDTQAMQHIMLTRYCRSLLCDPSLRFLAVIDDFDCVHMMDRQTQQTQNFFRVTAIASRGTTLYYAKNNGRLCTVQFAENATEVQTNIFLPPASGSRPRLSLHPTLPLLAYTNNNFALNGKAHSVSIWHLEAQKQIGQIDHISNPIVSFQWLTQTGRLMIRSRFAMNPRERALLNVSDPSRDHIDVIALDNFHDHYQLPCHGLTHQVVVGEHENILLTAQHHHVQCCELPKRPTPEEKLSLSLTLNNGQQVSINGVRLLKILHRSVETILAPIVRANLNTPKATLQRITAGEDWLKIAGRMATYYSGEVAFEDGCAYVRHEDAKVYGTVRVQAAGHATPVEVKKEHVTIHFARSGSYVDFAYCINQVYLAQHQAERANAYETYRALNAALSGQHNDEPPSLDDSHAALARTLLTRLAGGAYPEAMPQDVKRFFDSLLVLLFGVEASRVNTTFLTGVMLLDLIAHHCTFGRFNRVFSWQNALTSGPGYSWNDYEQRDHGGKFPLASQSTGPSNLVNRRKILQSSTQQESAKLRRIITDYQHHQVCKKEIKTALHWLKNLSSEHADFLADANDQAELERRLAQLFMARMAHAYRYQMPNINPSLALNRSGAIRQYELRTDAQMQTHTPHYYLTVKNQTTGRLQVDRYYHRVDAPCKLVAADFRAGQEKVISHGRHKYSTVAHLQLTHRRVTGLVKCFNLDFLNDGVLAEEAKITHFHGKKMKVYRETTPLSNPYQVLLQDTHQRREEAPPKRPRMIQAEAPQEIDPRQVSDAYQVLLQDTHQSREEAPPKRPRMIQAEAQQEIDSRQVSDAYQVLLQDTRQSRGEAPPKKSRVSQDESPEVVEPRLVTPLKVLLRKFITDVFMPHFDFFCNVPDVFRQVESADDILRHPGSGIDPSWLKIIENSGALYTILNSIQFTQVPLDAHVKQLQSTITFASLKQSIQTHAPKLIEKDVETLAESIFKTIERRLFSTSFSRTQLHVPELLVQQVMFDPEGRGQFEACVFLQPDMQKKLLEYAKTISSHNLVNDRALTLVVRLLSSITGFQFIRAYSVSDQSGAALCACPKCYGESAPPYPAMPFIADESVCAVSTDNPYYHRIADDAVRFGCDHVGTMPDHAKVQLVFVKHAADILGKLYCQACWLPVLHGRAQAVQGLMRTAPFFLHRSERVEPDQDEQQQDEQSDAQQLSKDMAPA